MTERPESEDRKPEFDRAVHEYYQSIESGKRVEQQAFIDAHPGFKEELRSFFADLNGLIDAFGTLNSAGTDGVD